MSLTISSLYFSPIKSLSFQNIKKATIKKQIGILHDRILAFSRGVDLTKAKQIEQDPTQRELINFMTLKNTPALNKYNFELKDNCIYLSEDTKEIICSSIDSEEQRQELANKIIELKEIERFVDGAAVRRVGDKNFEICKQNLDGVGKNLQDHLDTMVTVRSKKAESIGVSWRSLIPQVLTSPFNFLFRRMGWWTSNFVEAGGFSATKLGSPEYPDVQFHFTPIYRSHRGRKFEFGHGYSLFTCLLRPHSRGSVKLHKDGETHQVLIDHNFLSDSRDEVHIVEAIKKARELLSSQEFDSVRGDEIAPGKSIQSDEDLLEYIRHSALTVYHPVGTCKMGIDELAVVSPSDLKVKGMRNLRVIDASIMPNIVSGNTSAPTMMIAEKGARMILDKV